MLDGIKGQRIIAGAHADASGGVCPMVAAEVHLPWEAVSQSNVKTAQQAAWAWDRYAEASGSSHTATKRQLLALTAMLEASILQEAALTELPLSDAIAEYQRARSGRASVGRASVDVPADIPLPRPSSPAAPVTRYLSLADAYEVSAEDPSEVPAERRTPERRTPYEAPAARPIPVEMSAERPSTGDLAPEHPSPVEVPAPRPSSRKRRNTGEHDRSSELHERDGWAWMRPFRSYDEYEETLLRALAELDTHERQLEELQVR